MRVSRSKKMALPIISLAAMIMLSGCGSSADSASSDSNSSTESDSGVETGIGAMADADFAVTVLLETIWPIEGNDYAEPALVEPWCATYATDPNAAILSVNPAIGLYSSVIRTTGALGQLMTKFS